VATFAILALLTGICTWYRPGGRLTKEAIVAAHEKLVLSSVAPHRAQTERHSPNASHRVAR
jgi:tetracycline repressor-like protein